MEFPTHTRSDCAVINCAAKAEGKTVRVWGSLQFAEHARLSTLPAATSRFLRRPPHSLAAIPTALFQFAGIAKYAGSLYI